MITQDQQDLEDRFYNILNVESFKTALKRYNLNDSETTANMLRIGMMSSWVGSVVNRLKHQYPHVNLDCEWAFQNACKRIIDSIKIGQKNE